MPGNQDKPAMPARSRRRGHRIHLPVEEPVIRSDEDVVVRAVEDHDARCRVLLELRDDRLELEKSSPE
jgi:hypothetical protein